MSIFFFFNDTSTTEIYTLSLHDALPISLSEIIEYAILLIISLSSKPSNMSRYSFSLLWPNIIYRLDIWRSEEHTSELQSRPHLVCRLLLEKKKKKINKHKHIIIIVSHYL